MKQPEIEERMRAVSHALNGMFNGYGHVVILFEFGKPGTTNYMSNAPRKDMIKALRESADVLEAQQDMPVFVNVSTELQ